MNERIRALAEQANEAFYQRMGEGAERGTFYFDGFAEKFAELLVRECVAQNQIAIQSLKDRPEDIPGWKTMMNLAQVTCQNQIAKHFEVDL